MKELLTPHMSYDNMDMLQEFSALTSTSVSSVNDNNSIYLHICFTDKMTIFLKGWHIKNITQTFVIMK